MKNKELRKLIKMGKLAERLKMGGRERAIMEDLIKQLSDKEYLTSSQNKLFYRIEHNQRLREYKLKRRANTDLQSKSAPIS